MIFFMKCKRCIILPLNKIILYSMIYKKYETLHWVIILQGLFYIIFLFTLKTIITIILTKLNCMVSFIILTRNFLHICFGTGTKKIEYFSKMSDLLFYLFKCLKFSWLYFCKSCTIKNPMKKFMVLVIFHVLIFSFLRIFNL
jgi:hypothetical protein